jgi:hypothetical protein
MKRSLTVLGIAFSAALVALGAAAPAGAEGQAGFGCSPGFDIGPDVAAVLESSTQPGRLGGRKVHRGRSQVQQVRPDRSQPRRRDLRQRRRHVGGQRRHQHLAVHLRHRGRRRLGSDPVARAPRARVRALRPRAARWLTSSPLFGASARAAVPTAAALAVVFQFAQNGQLPGSGSSIRLAAADGTSETTIVTRSTLPSFRTVCTPVSKNPDPAGYASRAWP